MSRYIDADALKEWIDEYVSVFKKSDNKDIKGYIEHQPTIEPKRGEWIEHKERTIVRDNNFVDFFPTEYECSNCGLRRDTYSINSPLSNYCPNCGARMKGADDE